MIGKLLMDTMSRRLRAQWAKERGRGALLRIHAVVPSLPKVEETPWLPPRFEQPCRVPDLLPWGLLAARRRFPAE